MAVSEQLNEEETFAFSFQGGGKKVEFVEFIYRQTKDIL